MGGCVWGAGAVRIPTQYVILQARGKKVGGHNFKKKGMISNAEAYKN